nr:hypothetical protein [Candidatus Gracilibacteria bacterium]
MLFLEYFSNNNGEIGLYLCILYEIDRSSFDKNILNYKENNYENNLSSKIYKIKMMLKRQHVTNA